MLDWSNPIASHGVIIGAEKSQEWLLGWWYAHYRAHNDFPIAICDFGLSSAGREKAAQIGYVLDIDKDYLLRIFSQKLCKKKEAAWKELYIGPVKNIHAIWMLKPFGLKQTPFEKSIWIDLDCEVRDSIAPIFSYLNNSTGFTIAPDTPAYQKLLTAKNYLLPGETMYNTGVFGFKHRASIIDLWTQEVLALHQNYLSDQDALSRIIHRHRLPINRLSKAYNARKRDAHNPAMKIIHYVHIVGKMHILEEMLLKAQY